MSRKQPHHTPEASASQLLIELREMTREARETMAELKSLRKSCTEERKAIQAEREALAETIECIYRGEDVREQILSVLGPEIESHVQGITAATKEAQEVITLRFKQMASALTGLPQDVFSKNQDARLLTTVDDLLLRKLRRAP